MLKLPGLIPDNLEIKFVQPQPPCKVELFSKKEMIHTFNVIVDDGERLHNAVKCRIFVPRVKGVLYPSRVYAQLFVLDIARQINIHGMGIVRKDEKLGDMSFWAVRRAAENAGIEIKGKCFAGGGKTLYLIEETLKWIAKALGYEKMIVAKHYNRNS